MLKNQLMEGDKVYGSYFTPYLKKMTQAKKAVNSFFSLIHKIHLMEWLFKWILERMLQHQF